MKILVIDGNSIINRAFYGIRMLTNKDGIPTNAVYGFLKIYKKLLDMCAADCVAVAFDLSEPTFRHKKYAEYKAGRHKMPDELHEQMPILKNILHLMGIKTLEVSGFEADDILGTFAKNCEDTDNHCYIATGDRDSLQLVSENATVLLASNKETKVYTPKSLFDEYGVTPKEMIEIKALQGDSSDNIPGVAGVGQKTASSLIQNYHSIDYIYENIDSLEIKEGVRTKLKNGKESAYLSHELGTIVTNAPINTDLNNYKLTQTGSQKAVEEFKRLELYSLIDTFGLKNNADLEKSEDESVHNEKVTEFFECENTQELFEKLEKEQSAYFIANEFENEITDIYFEIKNQVFAVRRENKEFDSFCKKFFESEIKKYTYNTKTLHHLAINLGCEIKNICFDIMLGAYILKPSENNYTIERLALEYGVSLPKITDDMGTKKTEIEATAIKELSDKMQILIKKNNEEKLLGEIEIPLARVLAEMEHEGFAADKEGIENFSEKLQIRIAELTDEIYNNVGYEFNINSPKQLGVALFEELGLPVIKKTKSGYSTNAEVLEKLENAHPVIPLITEYRQLTKLKSTYCDGLLKVIGKDGRIHTSFNQVETRTGRISSLEPNLQNIPIRTELGREMRKFFTAKDGCMLVDADYSQIELRVLAALADDKNMIDAFNSNQDIHTITASQVFNMPVNMVTPQMRSSAKAVNFGIVYGIGAFSLSNDIHVSVKEAKNYIDGYLNHYQGVKKYMDDIITLAKDKGYSETLFGRKRYLPELNAKNHMLKAFGERVARNMPIQGTAADIIKIAMIRVSDRIKKEKLKSRLILQVHDELIVEAPNSEAEIVKKLVTEEMENACNLSVKLTADANIGKTWYDAH